MISAILYHGDAIEVMKQLKDESIDLVLTDPPYNVSENSTIIKDNKNGKIRYIGLDAYWDKIPEEDYFKLIYGFLDETYRVLKKSGSLICFTSDTYLSYLRKYIINKGMVYRQTCVWIKSNPIPQFRKVKFMHATELFFCANKQKGFDSFRWEEGERSNVFFHPSVQGAERLDHPTQKPVWLMKELIKYYTKEGDMVLDPFVGSGTTMEAAMALKRNSIGIEINDEYISMIAKRLNKYTQQTDLNGNKFNFQIIEYKKQEVKNENY
ncbi:MAG: DNA methyltransferase [Thermoplasmatales archaeon]